MHAFEFPHWVTNNTPGVVQSLVAALILLLAGRALGKLRQIWREHSEVSQRAAEIYAESLIENQVEYTQALSDYRALEIRAAVYDAAMSLAVIIQWSVGFSGSLVIGLMLALLAIQQGAVYSRKRLLDAAFRRAGLAPTNSYGRVDARYERRLARVKSQQATVNAGAAATRAATDGAAQQP